MKKTRTRICSVIAAIIAVLTVTPCAMADLNGIDVSGYQTADITAAVPADFAIVKATQGLYRSNPNYDAQLMNADKTGKESSVYHFANGGNAVSEADAFLNVVWSRVGKSQLTLDWEKCLAYGRYGCTAINPNWGNPQWIQTWVDRVYQRTQVWPVVYVQRSAVWQINSYVRKHCMLWVAQYANNNATGYQSNPWNAGASGEGMTQYTSSGYLNGRGPLDLNVFYGDRTAWRKIACGERSGCMTGNTVSVVNPAPAPANNTTNGCGSQCVVVKAGDTVSKYWSDWWNVSVPSGNPNRIYAGQTICHKGAVQSNTVRYTRYYRVQAGDTLGRIANRYGVSVYAIRGYKSGNINLIYPNELLYW